MNVLAIDPGERVGWATGRVLDSTKAKFVGQHFMLPSGTPGRYMLEVQDHGILPLKDFAMWLFEQTVIEHRFDVIVFETFRPRPAADARGAFIGSELPTVQLIGMIRLCAWASKTQLFPQSPKNKTDALLSMRNPGGEDIQARLAKMPRKHDDAHDGDALLHLWHYYFTHHYGS